jgi:predicted enzyme related to lactoylglutathione lyase
MTEGRTAEIGARIGFDLTVPNAEEVRDFYASVLGWTFEPLSMGDYDDYFMKNPANGEVVAGVCHALGMNADLPPQWLTYFVVADLDASLRQCEESGGVIVSAIKGGVGEPRYCVIQDPAGAYMALMEFPTADA